MNQHDIALEWLSLAQDDLNAAKALVANTLISDAIVGFHCQQAAEKAMKTVLIEIGIEFPRTHDLVLLRDLLESVGHGLPPGLRSVADLNPYGVTLRYGRVALPPWTENRQSPSPNRHASGPATKFHAGSLEADRESREHVRGSGT